MTDKPIARLAYDTAMWTRLSAGPPRKVTIPADTRVRVTQETDTPDGTLYMIETLDGQHTAQRLDDTFTFALLADEDARVYEWGSE